MDWKKVWMDDWLNFIVFSLWDTSNKKRYLENNLHDQRPFFRDEGRIADFAAKSAIQTLNHVFQSFRHLK